MKILHVCAIGSTAETLLLRQINYFLSQGFEVGIACSFDEDAQRLKDRGYTVHPVEIDRKISLIPNLKSISVLTKIIRENNYDLVHVHTPIAAVLGRIAAKLAGVKAIIYTAHGFPFHDLSSRSQYFLYSNIEKYAATITDLILTQNHEDIATAKKLRLCPPEKLAYLGNGVDIERFKRSQLNPQSQSQLRQSLGIPDASLIVGTIARLTRKKGVGYLVEAAGELISEFPNLHIVIIGSELSTDPEPFQIELCQKIKTLGLEKHVTLTGERQDIPELLGILDIFTLPTFTHEGLPRSIVEAMAMNLPIVTTDVRGCREAVVNQKNGFIVPSQNSTELAEALRKLLSNPQLRQDYGKASRERVEVEYNEDFVFKRLAQYYKELEIN
ncbi:MAG: glycosyltransferase family 4 protein [Rivularia sp. (in: cyanobacteria)]|jgi:glycosyltransferase involved in cell wall biosynthesis